MKLVNLKNIKGRIILESGLHIGAGDTEMHIGGTDNPVVTHPHTREPYIPGSSLKGKIRSLLEMRSGLMSKTDGKPIGLKVLSSSSDDERKEALKILHLFGMSGADSDDSIEVGPTRGSFADCPLSRESVAAAKAKNWPLTEVKSENSINRIKGIAENPRFTERVPAGLSFDFTFSIKEMEGDEDLVDFLLQGVKLLELDALGGSGSRGYGRVRFQFADESLQQKYNAVSPLG
ncbi:MAG: type III-A CRISPR-associated RAMP protein Csm3 [Thermodesulfobacteriota bacterium]|nr:type III-A CRISPR-associated RAMP protein Csm3 [Thermodesulfobacteriota bacterium]